MADAVRRLRELPTWDKWITFCAQGQGHRPDSYTTAEVRHLHDELDVGSQAVDTEAVSRRAQLMPGVLVIRGTHLLLQGASPVDVARVLDALFRDHFGLRPFPDEGDDYPVGAEW
jgi:hypothetical protein